MIPPAAAPHRWFRTGGEFFDWLPGALAGARRSVRFEFYIFANDETGRATCARLAEAARRGVQVRVLIDGLAAAALPGDFWGMLTDAGGEVRVFNPLQLRRLTIRSHRKLVVIDDEFAVVGGFNVADEYRGDGVERGWADCGLGLAGPAVALLARSFDRMFAQFAVRQPRRLVARWGRGLRPPPEQGGPGLQLLLSGPGRHRSAFQELLRRDVAQATAVRFVSAYFLPASRMRRMLRAAALRGGRVQIIVPGRSDVALARQAARHLYTGLLRAGVEIWEYEPQILHSKLFLANGAAYVGSSNLDTRSLHINFELMLRVTGSDIVAGAETIFSDLLSRSRRVEPEVWRRSRSWWERLSGQFAFWLLSRVDPYLTRWLAAGPR